MRKARSPHHFAYQKSNVSFPVFPVPNKCIFIWGAMFGHTCFYKEMWFKYEKRTRLSIKIYTYIYVCSYICSYVLRNAASSSGSRGQRSDSHVDQRTPLRAGPNLPNNKEKRWGRHWTSSNTSPESPPKQRRWRSLLDWNLNWLVVDLPLWKIWKSVGMIIPNILKSKKCSKPQTS